MSRESHVPAVACLGAFLWACSGPQANVPADVLLRMQSEARTEIYDRENDLSIARDRLDEARDREAAVRRERADVDEAQKRLKVRLGKAGGDREGKVGKSIDAHRSYLDAQLRQLSALQDVYAAQADAAHARLEQTRQRELVRTGRELAKSMKAFDKNVEAQEKRVASRERREGDIRLETEKAYEAWQAAAGEYAKTTGDWDSAIWTD